MSNTNTSNPIAPEQMAAILSAAAQALLAPQPASSTAVATDAAGAATGGNPDGASNSSALPAPAADILAATITQTGTAAAPAPVAAPAVVAALATQSNDPEQLALLKKIDTNLTDLSTRIVKIEKTAIRNGAIAGGVAGGISGGIVATGLAFVRSHLGI